MDQRHSLVRAGSGTGAAAFAQVLVDQGQTAVDSDRPIRAGEGTLSATGAAQRVDLSDHRLQGDRSLVDQGKSGGSCSTSLRHAVGDILRALASSSQVDALGGCLNRGQFRVPLQEKAIPAAADPEQAGHLGDVSLRLKTGRQDYHIDPHMIRLVVETLVPLDEHLAVYLLDGAHFAVVEVHTFLLRAVVKLFVVLTEGAHIAVDLVHLRLDVIAHQLGDLERVHAAGPRAVIVVALVTAAHAMQDGHALGWLAVLEQHLASSRAAGVDQALELHAGDDILTATEAELGRQDRIEVLKTCCQDDRTHSQVNPLVLHIMVNRAA